jgi:hypothetical protein
MSRGRRWVFFAVIFCLVLLWVATAGAGEEGAARAFLRNLLRNLF